MSPLGAVLVVLLAAAPARALLQPGQSNDVFSAIDDDGNLITVSNRTDGAASYVQLTSFNRYRGMNWDRSHADGFLERVTSIFVDPTGNLLLAGVRLWQGATYIWVMKYAPSGQLLWENADSAPGCVAFAVVGNEDGETWAAGSCLDQSRSPARLIHISPSGGTRWSQSYDEGGRSYVRGLNLDFSGRVTLSIEMGSNQYGGGSARGVVYNKNGGRVAVY